MAALCGPTCVIPSTVSKSRSSKQGRSRPNLSKLCQKTKMCSFFLRGACARAEGCSFAHDEKELQAKPDLSCTKPCPELLKIGYCSRPGCKFAHDDFQIRQLDLDGRGAPASEPGHMPAQATKSSTTHGQISCTSSFSGSSSSIPPARQKLREALNDAKVIGFLSMVDMISHLTHIFSTLYEARPALASRLNLPADVVASATAKSAWADAGIDSTSVLSFQDVVRWCALPSDVLLQGVPQEEDSFSQNIAPPRTGPSQRTLKCTKLSAENDDRSEDGDTWSQCSTDEGTSSHSLSRSNSTEWETPESLQDLEEEDWCEPELEVMNTFIHFAPRRGPNRVRRAKSLPNRLSKSVSVG